MVTTSVNGFTLPMSSGTVVLWITIVVSLRKCFYFANRKRTLGTIDRDRLGMPLNGGQFVQVLAVSILEEAVEGPKRGHGEGVRVR